MKLYRRLPDYENPNSLGSRLRRRRAGLLDAAIRAAAHGLDRKLRLVDIGGREVYWQILSPGFLDKHVEHILLLSPEEPETAHGRLFSRAVADACDLRRFADSSFRAYPVKTDPHYI